MNVFSFCMTNFLNKVYFVARRSWTLVTQKLPLINGVRKAPKWAKCSYKSNPGGIAHIVRYVPLEKREFIINFLHFSVLSDYF